MTETVVIVKLDVSTYFEVLTLDNPHATRVAWVFFEIRWDVGWDNTHFEIVFGIHVMPIILADIFEIFLTKNS